MLSPGPQKITWNELSPSQKVKALRRPRLHRSLKLKRAVREIMSRVRSGGDQAVRAATLEFDRVKLDGFEVDGQEKKRAWRFVNADVVNALELASANIEKFHKATASQPVRVEVSPGLKCRREARPIERVGLYIPGGSAPLPSTVLMLGVPSRLAGCAVRVLCSPPRPDGRLDEAILVAAEMCGIDRIFKIGGAQAIAAMAYGTETVPKVDKLFGPGNAWVTEAKIRAASDARGAAADMPAGPSEVMVVADAMANAAFIASDLLSQAEHGPDSQVVFVTSDSKMITKVEQELARQLKQLSRREIASQSLANSVLILVNEISQAITVANQYAPEHLILLVDKPSQYINQIQNAGSVFLGPWSPEAIGDYASGTNHVLPTYGHARAFSGCSVESFRKQITFQELSLAALKKIGPVAETLARAEGLEAHRNAIRLRLSSLEANR